MSELKSRCDQWWVQALWVALWWNDLWRILGWSKCSELALSIGFERRNKNRLSVCPI